MSSFASETPGEPKGPARTCAVIHPAFITGSKSTRASDTRLEEAVRLAGAIDLKVVHQETVKLNARAPGTLFGKGTVERLADALGLSMTEEIADHDEADKRAHKRGHTPARRAHVDLAIINAELTPVQQRNLEKAWKCKVIDRTGLILEIFGARARTKAGRLQVELASLTYQRSRLVRSWTHLERQRGGLGFVGGPGETQIETDRRLISERIVQIKRQLKDVERTRRLHREARNRVPYRSIALVGYTNAGKSTLFNRLTEAQVLAKDQLFATLDPTMREIKLPSGETAILSDTVGFISDLPHELVTAFHATLEEVCESDMILHVQDASHEDWQAQHDDVITVLRTLDVLPGPDNGSTDLKTEFNQKFIDVLNKSDSLDEDKRTLIGNRKQRSNTAMVVVSAITGEGTGELLELIDKLLTEDHLVADVVMAYENGTDVAWLYDHGNVLSREDTEEGVHLQVRLSPADFARLEKGTTLRLSVA